MNGERHGPAHGELGMPVGFSAVLARSMTSVILLQGLQVFGDGVCLAVDAVKGRQGESDSEWMTQIDLLSAEFLDVLSDNEALNLRVSAGFGEREDTLDVVLLSGYQQSTRSSSKTSLICWVDYLFNRDNLVIAACWRSAGVEEVVTQIPNKMLLAARDEARQML